MRTLISLVIGLFPCIRKPFHHLIEKVLAGRFKRTGTKTCNGTVIRSFPTCYQPHEIDVSFICSFDFSGRINILRISIGQDLEHGLRVNCWISAFGRVSLIQQRVIQFLQFVAEQSDGVIIRKPNLSRLIAKPVDKSAQVQYNL